MKVPLMVSLLALGLSTVTLAAVMRAPTSRQAASAVEPDTAAAAEPGTQWIARLDELEDENRTLRDQLALLQSRPAPAPRREPVLDAFVTRDELEAFARELRAELAQDRALPATESPEFAEQVAGTLQKIRKAEAEVKIRDYQDARSERLDEDVERIREWLDLNPAQTDAMRNALIVQYEREVEQRLLWENGEDDVALEERKRADGELFDADLAEFLSEEQRTTFWEGILGGDK